MVGVNIEIMFFLSYQQVSHLFYWFLFLFHSHEKERIKKKEKKKIKFQCHVKIQIPQIVDDDWILSFGICTIHNGKYSYRV